MLKYFVRFPIACWKPACLLWVAEHEWGMHFGLNVNLSVLAPRQCPLRTMSLNTRTQKQRHRLRAADEKVPIPPDPESEHASESLDALLAHWNLRITGLGSFREWSIFYYIRECNSQKCHFYRKCLRFYELHIGTTMTKIGSSFQMVLNLIRE